MQDQKIRPQFDSFYHESQNLIAIITHDVDDFGNRRECHNLISIEQAVEVIKNLQQTISNYQKNN